METTKILHIDAKKPVLIDKSRLENIEDDFLFVMDSIQLPGGFNVIIDCKYFAREYAPKEAMVFEVTTHFLIHSDNTALFSDPEQKNSCTLLDNLLMSAIAHLRMHHCTEGKRSPMNSTGNLPYIPLEEAKAKTVGLYEERV